MQEKKISDWELPNIEGDLPLRPSALKGNVIVLEFWFKNCPPCVEAIPALNNLYKKYGNTNFEFYGIEFLNETKENVNKYIEGKNIQYPMLYNGKAIASLYKISSAPTFLIVDKTGIIRYAKSGFNKKEIVDVIEKYLQYEN